MKWQLLRFPLILQGLKLAKSQQKSQYVGFQKGSQAQTPMMVTSLSPTLYRTQLFFADKGLGGNTFTIQSISLDHYNIRVRRAEIPPS